MVVPLHMDWRHVLFANWPVDPEVVRPHVPDQLPLDTFDGQAWLSVVPFTNVDVRPTWLPAGTGIRLPELNLRTYVALDDVPGVYFLSLDIDGITAVLGARLFHHLPYYLADVDLTVEGDRIHFESERRHRGARPARYRATYGPVGEEFLAEPGSLEEFLTDRLRLYTTDSNGSVRYTDVSHPPWPLYEVETTVEENTLFAANDFDFPESEPVELYSPGVDTRVSPSRRL